MRSKWNTIALGVALITSAGAVALKGDMKVNHRVEVDGKAYRVEVKGQQVKVFDKAVTTGKSPERGERLRKAVVVATGCTMRDGYWESAHLAGVLDCDPTLKLGPD